MKLPDYSLELYYTTPPNNYFGTTIFLSYILAALYASFTISSSLYRQYTTILSLPTKDDKPSATKQKKTQHVKFYATLAFSSFAILSFNMLMFLVSHYTTWCDEKNLRVSDTSARELGSWMLDSTLFRDFAADLVKDASNAMWSQAAILETWVWNIWMARKARQFKIDTATMRTYILLSQILPISFTACLFISQLHLLSPDQQPPGQKDQQTHSAHKIGMSLQIPNLLLNMSFLALPFLHDHGALTKMVLLERVILLLPHFKWVNVADRDLRSWIVTSGIFVAVNAVIMRELSMVQMIRALTQGGFAVKALAWDAIFGALVFWFLRRDGTVSIL